MLFPRIIFNEINYDNWEQESISTPFSAQTRISTAVPAQ